MFAVVGLHCSFEGFEGVVDVFVYGHVYFGRCSPEYHHAVKVLFGLEVADIFAELFYEFPACAGFYVIAVEAGSVAGVEGGLEGLDGFEFVANGLDVFFFEHFGVDCRLVSVSGVNVPGGEFNVVEVGDGNDFVVSEVFFVCTLTYTHAVVLCHRANGLGKAFASHQNTGHESGSHGAEAYYHHT